MILLVSEEAYAGQPVMEIEGVPAIRRHAVLSDKRHILTKDTKGNVHLYDALQVCIQCVNVSYFLPTLIKFKLTYTE